MKLFKNIYSVLILVTLLFATTFPMYSVAKEETHQYQFVGQESQLSPDDWKIVIDEKKSSNEFGFIQRNLDSSNLADNGQFLLVAGIILLVLSGTGVIFFSFCLYKLLKASPQKSASKRGGSRYK